MRNLEGRELLTPRKQLFDYTRVKAVKAGRSTTVTFNITAAALAEVDEKSGDLVSEAGIFNLRFEDGSGKFVPMTATVQGKAAVLEPFPSEV